MIELVTPDQARTWIRHSHQRKIDLSKCRKMLDAIERGDWKPSRQKLNPIIISTKRGCVANGHHRLTAILIHGEPVECEVEYRQ